MANFRTGFFVLHQASERETAVIVIVVVYITHLLMSLRPGPYTGNPGPYTGLSAGAP